MATLHFVDVGSGVPLLLVHGDLANGALAWGAQIASLGATHRLLVPDRRGHGASPREPRPYTIAGDAADLLSVADAADVRAFHLVGQSYGGLVAIEAARRAPDRLLSLQLIEPPYLALLPDDPDVAPLLAAAGIFARAGSWPPEKTAERFLAMIAGPAYVERLRGRPIWSAVVAEAGRIVHAEFPGDYPPNALEDLRLEVPLRVYSGGRSHPGLRKIALALAGRLRGAELVEIPEAGHDVQRAGKPFEAALLASVDL